MAKFEGTFKGRTTGGEGLKVTAGGVLAAVGAGIVLTHRHQSAQAAGTAAVFGAVVFGVVMAAAVVFAVVRVRGHRGTGGGRRPSPLLCTVSPPAIPAREAPRAVAAPVQPVINNFFGADATAAFLREQARACRVTAEPIEQQEIR